ncbi:hypothetical protein M9458_031352, partial [Cirrhinus mrigala]
SGPVQTTPEITGIALTGERPHGPQRLLHQSARPPYGCVFNGRRSFEVPRVFMIPEPERWARAMMERERRDR